MNFSSFLNSRREVCRALVSELGKSFSYVGVLGSDVRSSAIRVNRAVSDIGEGSASECGFVIKMHNGRAFFEYSIDDIAGDIPALANKIVDAVKVEESLIDKEISVSPVEILEKLNALNAEGRPIWKPMHMQPIYKENIFVSREDGTDAGEDIFARGLCLPSDNKMTAEEQNVIIEVIKSCFE